MNPAATFHSIRTTGLRPTARGICDRWYDWYMDCRLGIDTGGAAPDDGGECRYYVGTKYRHLRLLFNALAPTSADTLLDYGAGLGRVLVYARKFTPINECAGVELDADLVRRGRRNIELSNTQAATLHHIDAQIYTPWQSILFFSNPFTGRVLSQVMWQVNQFSVPGTRLVTKDYQRGSAFYRQMREYDWLTVEREIDLGGGEVGTILIKRTNWGG